MGSPLLTISSASLDNTGTIVTLTIANGSGSLLPTSGITGFTISADGVNMIQSTVTASGFTVTITLRQVVSFASIVVATLAGLPNTNLADTAGNTPTGTQGNVAVTNNSLVNTYISLSQFVQRYDKRTMLQLSGDDNARQGNQSNLQQVLNDASGELESSLDGRYVLSQVRYALPMPRVLTRWVGIKGREALYGRRTSKPRGLISDTDWAERWIEKIIEGIVNIPGIGRQVGINNLAPPRTQFDHIFDDYISPAGYW